MWTISNSLINELVRFYGVLGFFFHLMHVFDKCLVMLEIGGMDARGRHSFVSGTCIRRSLRYDFTL